MDEPHRTGDHMERLHVTSSTVKDTTSTPPQSQDKEGSPLYHPNVPHFVGTGDEIETFNHSKTGKRGSECEDPKRALSGVQLERDFHAETFLGSEKLSGQGIGSTAQQDIEQNLPYTQ
ncbi:uncharacterized protein SPPG_01309 [Spizellomyces punctatus DAOM BR117]|uniref:Uncharacterized protein n=1 Tax=Spizellomyces punctatus (strain DAOM BR117) TaxID=645134 RepID=A0A0L0HSH2_SPIPD|nr:uncharacterized protein SPPG_01309 [Spizellomyces punctatus DAOM BR117]KND03855.1 hypothetical protein SPPG_01309 [Spizellomyces punctatus DAOM BR117]|eukprot:XP_016611894.1 hypothetical protein SPPG_01309 [Spizellomyces punctatus DAOM BR117]